MAVRSIRLSPMVRARASALRRCRRPSCQRRTCLKTYQRSRHPGRKFKWHRPPAAVRVPEFGRIAISRCFDRGTCGLLERGDVRHCFDWFRSRAPRIEQSEVASPRDVAPPAQSINSPLRLRHGRTDRTPFRCSNIREGTSSRPGIAPHTRTCPLHYRMGGQRLSFCRYPENGKPIEPEPVYRMGGRSLC